MLAQMMDQQLLISGLIQHAESYHGEKAIISRLTEGVFTATTIPRPASAAGNWPARYSNSG